MPDSPSAVALDPRAPDAERAQAELTVAKQVAPWGNDLAREVRYLSAALNAGEYIPGFSPALAKSNPIQQGSKQPQTVFYDPWATWGRGSRYVERPTALSYDVLKAMTAQVPLLNAVVLTRIRQVWSFIRKPDRTNPLGFAVKLRNEDKHPTADQKQEMEYLRRWLLACGDRFLPHERHEQKRDHFRGFLAKYVRDTLATDNTGIEMVRAADPRWISGFHCIDGASLRLCSEEGYEGNDSIFAVQLIQGQVRTTYTRRNLIHEPRNVRSDVQTGGYGLSEAEMVVDLVTAFLNAMTLNKTAFTSNAIPPGILTMFGEFSTEDKEFFRRQWDAMVSGASNRWRLPVMFSPRRDAAPEYIKIGAELNEMMFAKWMLFLVAITGGVYGIDPSELHFDSFRDKASPLSGSDTAERLASSKDQGLEPLLETIQMLLDDYLFGQMFDGRYTLSWEGLHPEDAKSRSEIQTQVCTVDEVRAREDLPPHPDKMIGGAPLNPSLIGLYQAAQQQQMGGQPGMPGQAPPGQEGQDAFYAQGGDEQDGQPGNGPTEPDDDEPQGEGGPPGPRQGPPQGPPQGGAEQEQPPTRKGYLLVIDK